MNPARIRDEALMRRCMALAAASTEEAPIAALVVREGEVVAESANRVEADRDPAAHAEMLAIRAAAATLGAKRLPECELYVTVEPCAMCAGAIELARLRRIVFGAWEPKTGAFGSRLDFRDLPGANPDLEVTPGVLARECGEAMRAFFQARR